MEKIKTFFSHVAWLWTGAVAIIGILSANVSTFIDKKMAEKERLMQYESLKAEYAVVAEKVTSLAGVAQQNETNLFRLQSRIRYLEQLARVHKDEIEEISIQQGKIMHKSGGDK